MAKRRFLAATAPWGLFLLSFLWLWRVNPFNQLPGYGDTLESLWWTDFYRSTLLQQGFFPTHFPLFFYPEGLHLGAISFGLGLLPVLLLLQSLGGAAFAFNAATLLAQGIAFAGGWRLARHFVSVPGATLAALIYVFWIGRWVRMEGHLNLLLATALLPWMTLALVRLADSAATRSALPAAGAVWAAMIWSSLYAVWLGAVVAVGWTAGNLLAQRWTFLAALKRLLLIALIAGLCSAPVLLWFWQAKGAASAEFFTAGQLADGGASVNALPIPSLSHPLFGGLVSTYLYRGDRDERTVFNFGLLASPVALAGAWRARRQAHGYPLLATVAAGFLLMLGPALRVDDRFVTSDALRPLNQSLWQLGHLAKPDVFPAASPPAQLAAMVPLPGLLFAIATPFAEGVRYFSRFGFVAAVGFFILLALAMEHLRPRAAQAALAALLVVEIIPSSPREGVPFPVAPHPLFQWVEQHTAPSDGVMDVYAYAPDRLTLQQGGEVAWEARLHGRPILSGPGSVIPAHTQFALNWLWSHPHAFQSAEFPVLLRAYRMRYVLLHMTNAYAETALAEAARNPAYRVAQCAAPDSGQSAWRYPLCAVELLPSGDGVAGVALDSGWWSPEAWGTWAAGTESRFRWIATAKTAYRLGIVATPYCVEGQSQRTEVRSSQHLLARHEWSNCDAWAADIDVPQDIVQIGWNEVTIQNRYAWRPADVTQGRNGDPRQLSLAFSRLDVTRTP